MQINKELARKNFDRHAHQYDQFSHVQVYMGKRLLQLLDEGQQVGVSLDGRQQEGDPLQEQRIGRILEIGCGTGVLTKELLDRYPYAHVDAIDMSEEMLRQTEGKVGLYKHRVNLITGDAEEIVADSVQNYDMIVSNATFQWFNDPAATVNHCLRQLAPGGVMVFATFCPQTFHELHTSFASAEKELGLSAAQYGQGFYSGDMWSALFAEQLQDVRKGADCGIESNRKRGAERSWAWQEEIRLETYRTVRDFLRSIRRIGASNATMSPESGRQYVGKALIAAMERYYAQHFSSESGMGIEATYHLGWGYFRNAKGDS